MDADFSHNPNDLPRLYNKCAVEGYDVAIGSRYVSGVNVVNWPMGRVLMSTSPPNMYGLSPDYPYMILPPDLNAIAVKSWKQSVWTASVLRGMHSRLR